MSYVLFFCKLLIGFVGNLQSSSPCQRLPVWCSGRIVVLAKKPPKWPQVGSTVTWLPATREESTLLPAMVLAVAAAKTAMAMAVAGGGRGRAGNGTGYGGGRGGGRGRAGNGSGCGDGRGAGQDKVEVLNKVICTSKPQINHHFALSGWNCHVASHNAIVSNRVSHEDGSLILHKHRAWPPIE